MDRSILSVLLFSLRNVGVDSGSKQYAHAVADFLGGTFFKSEWSIGSLQSSVSGGLNQEAWTRSLDASFLSEQPLLRENLVLFHPNSLLHSFFDWCTV